MTIVEYSDFQCPYCSRVEPTMDQVRTTYGPDKVRVLWKNNPLPMHQNAKPAAEAAAGVFALAGSEAFWKFHDTAFKNQGALSEDSYEKWAKDSGVKDKDLPAYKAGLASHKWADKVDKDLNDGKAAGVTGTPAFFINSSSSTAPNRSTTSRRPSTRSCRRRRRRSRPERRSRTSTWR